MVFKDLPHLACYNHPPYLPWFSYSGLIDLIKSSRNSLCSGCSLCLEWSFPIYPCTLFFTTFQVSRVPASQWIWHHSLTSNTHSLDFFAYSYVSILYSSPSLGKASAYNVGDPGSIPRSGRSPGEGDGNPLQYSCLESPWTENPGRLQSTGSQESDTTEWLHFHFYFPYTKLHYLFICHDYCLSSPIKICWKVLTE